MTAKRAQRLVVFFIVLGLLFLCLVGCSGKEDPSKHAVFFTVGDFEYVVDSQDAATVGVVSYTPEKNAVSVEVPASVTFHDKTYSVVRIGACAFLSADVTFVVIEKGIRSIEEYAFAHCSAQEIDLPDTVVKVGERAFADCPFLHVVRFAAAHPPTLGGSAFSVYNREIGKYTDYPSLRIEIPDGNKDDYEEAGYPSAALKSVAITEEIH